MKLSEKRVPWWGFFIGLAALLVIVFMLIQRQRNDLEMLERRYDLVNSKRFDLQQEQSDKQHELSIANTADYIEARAREYGYMMPDEIRFVIQNPEALTDRATLDSAEAVIAQPAQPSGAETQPEESAKDAGDQDQPDEPVSEPADEIPAETQTEPEAEETV